MTPVTVVGAGLAGSEAAWQLAIRGIPVRLTEMKPKKMTPAHVSPWFAELVCSNSLRSDELTNAVGLLKEELRRLGSLIMLCADEHRVAAGGALAVDRVGFARAVTDRLRAHPLVEVVEEEVTDFPDGEVIIATGPLTSDAFADTILRRTGSEGMHFYDAVAPIVSLESVDMTSAFRASRYDKGTADYINCPMNAEEYEAFWRELISAREAEVHGFDDAGVSRAACPWRSWPGAASTLCASAPSSPWDCAIRVAEKSRTRWYSSGRTTPRARCTTWWAFRRIWPLGNRSVSFP